MVCTSRSQLTRRAAIPDRDREGPAGHRPRHHRTDDRYPQPSWSFELAGIPDETGPSMLGLLRPATAESPAKRALEFHEHGLWLKAIDLESPEIFTYSRRWMG